ncbi:tyrosine-protein kinase domain-containing protein [Mastigocoleus sp. MO_188.B34]|uniref:GumC family protein n=1 Tax=Mastigocoleus sp. MO_188.B34 TaxID=3036635 RepID=UPI002616A0C2|nr:tyrosine-protein kinase domain-containing protein [Mastigocoleus sp. MO_188.B34]MDJ0693583.1 lipopolysaccharide biosynthesis [Mastigocoleus sp. MO_188.B34]
MAPPIVKRYLIAFAKYKWIGCASFGLIVTGSTFMAMQPAPPPSYLGQSALSYTRPPVSFSVTGTEIQQQGQQLSKGTFLTSAVIEAVAEKVGRKPEEIARNLNIKLPPATDGGGGTIGLQYKDSDRKRAALTLQIYMQAMVKLSQEMNTRRLKVIIDNINQRLPLVQKELQAAERKLEVYDRLERPAILAAENGILLNAVTNSQAQQRQLKLTLSGIDAQIRSLQEKLGLDVERAYISSALSADPIIANLRSQIYQAETQMQILRRDLRPDHPTMIQLRRQKEAYEQLFQQRAEEVVGGAGVASPLPGNIKGIRSQSNLDPARQQLANQLVALQTQKETLQRQLEMQVQEEAKLRKQYSLIPNKQLERSRLEQQVALNRAVYDQIQAKLADAKAAEAETVSSLDIARPPSVIVDAKPPTSLVTTLGVGVFFGLIVGGGVIFLLGSLEGTFKTKEDIRESLKQKEVILLGELPLVVEQNLEPDILPMALEANSPYLEYCERLRSTVRRVGGQDVKVVLLCSTSSSEGKTFSAYHLGIASARAGKRTLIIETDLRSPSRCESLKVTPNSEASVEPLRYYGSLSECIRLVPDVENLYIIPSAGPVRQPAAVLESSEIKRLMEDARQRYDLVILDTHTLTFSNDALLIQPYSDGTIIVARPNYTEENLLSEAIDQLQESEMGLLGAIINGADITVSLREPAPEVEIVDDSPVEEPEEQLTTQ